MSEIENVKHLLKLKDVMRQGEVNGRIESTAEHTWACMMLAEHFLKTVKQPLDELKVLKLILYHDVVEIESGDVDALAVCDEESLRKKQADEKAGAKRLAVNIPSSLSEEFISSFEEYEKGETLEAKFALAIDKIEPLVHWALYHPEKLKERGWTESVVLEKKLRFIEPFPELLSFFDSLVKDMKQKNYL
jgi:putative hydrolase of HD superfamily